MPHNNVSITARYYLTIFIVEMISEDTLSSSYHHHLRVMDTQPTSENLHGEEPSPLQPAIVDLDLVLKKEEEAETLTIWMKECGDSIETPLTSQTESEGTHFSATQKKSHNNHVIPFQSNDDIEYYYDDVDSSTEFFDTACFTASEGCNSKNNICNNNKNHEGDVGDGEGISTLQYSRDAPEHVLQSLSSFFTEEEKIMMLPPDAVMNVEDKYFVVLPNSGTQGHTLFHCLGQITTGSEQDHKEIRESVVDYICSQAGWDIFGDKVVGFYENLIDEFTVSTTELSERFGKEDGEKFQRRVYRHYFMEEEIEGSLIELVAASILYGFTYTCIFVKESTNDSGKATCRVFHSSAGMETTIHEVETTLRGKKSSRQKEHARQINYLLRVGESPEDWKWTQVVPYLQTCFQDKAVTPSPCASMLKGSHDADLWHVYGLNWNKGTSSVKLLAKTNFRWKSGTSVLPTSSGKLLGGYVNLGNDLFSNLCLLIPNCLHTGNRCLLRDAVAYCPKNLNCFNFSTAASFADLILRSKEFATKKKSKLKKSKRQTNDIPPKEIILPQEELKVGTLKDLRRASKIFNFGYFVLGIDEDGELQSLGRLDRDKTIYLLARINRRNKITEWCALEDMRVYKTCLSEQSVGNLLISGSLSSSSTTMTLEVHQGNGQQSDLGTLLPPKSSSKLAGGERKSHRPTPFSLRISRYFTRLRFFIARIKSRNKVRQEKFFPLNDIDNHNNKSIVRTSVR